MRSFTPLVLLLFCLSVHAKSECSDIYFYRHTGGFLQSDASLLLIQDGEKLTTVRQGDRYKATICVEGQYDFIVKTDFDALIQNKESIEIKNGDTYYLKIGMSTGVDLPSISLKQKKDGEKDLNKGGKFKGEIESLSVKEFDKPTDRNVSQNAIENSSLELKKNQLVNNFQFDITEIIHAGEMLQIEFSITNLADHDREHKASNTA